MRNLIVALVIGILIGRWSKTSNDNEKYELVEVEETPRRSRSSSIGSFILGITVAVALMLVIPILLIEVTYVEETPDISGLIRTRCEPTQACRKIEPHQEKANAITLKVPEPVTLQVQLNPVPTYARVQVCINDEMCRDIRDAEVLTGVQGTVTFLLILRERLPTV